MPLEAPTPRRVALYLRVSTGDQTVENQVAPLQVEAERRGWVITETYRDEGISGAVGRKGRPALDKMLCDAARGRFDVVMVWALDRLGRSVKDLIDISYALEEVHVSLCFLKDGIDTTTPTGRLYFTIMSAIAAFERGRLTERVTAGMDRARLEGKRIGRPPIDDALKARIVELRGMGWGINKMATTLRTGSSTVRRVLIEAGAD